MAYQNYKELLSEIKSKVREAQLTSVMAANSQMLLLYWQMGQYILQNQEAEGWGTKIINKLSVDLKKEFPALKGFLQETFFSASGMYISYRVEFPNTLYSREY